MNKFSLGRVVMTAGVHQKCEEDMNFQAFVNDSVQRYIHCDWGELCAEDKKLNDDAVKNGDERILAEYRNKSYRIWIITEWDRSATTILFPEEY